MAQPINSSEPSDKGSPVSPMMIRRQADPMADPNQMPMSGPGGAPVGPPMGPGMGTPSQGMGGGVMSGGNELATILNQALEVIVRDGFSPEHANTLADFAATLNAVVGNPETAQAGAPEGGAPPAGGPGAPGM